MPASADWRTPPDIVERARHVLGGVIDLDPASDAEAQKVVRATRYLTREDDALASEWFLAGRTSVFLNPPGCGERREPRGQMPGLFWRKLMRYRKEGQLGHAIVIGFNIEDLSRTQAFYENQPMAHFPFCIPRERLRFIDARTGLPGKSPSHANVIVYVPGTIDRREVFAETFGPLGAVRL